jgi:predicted transposase YbfD/YdcC
MTKITTIGLDLAKRVFQVHGVDATGVVVLRKRLRRENVLIFFAQLPPCRIGIEAAHHWARELRVLRTVLAMESIRSVNGSGTVEAEIRYFLSSCHDDPTVLVQAIRRHWTIENRLHWVLDVTFREDDSRVRDRIAARNLAILRKIAINLMSRDRTTRAACGPVASRPPGMTITCSLFWLDDFMRRP